jgi:hypothetical protein
LRQKLELKQPLGLSHNTRGRVYTLAGNLEWGLRECQLAYSIFQELEAPRGLGLACNALKLQNPSGYGKRKMNWGAFIVNGAPYRNSKRIKTYLSNIIAGPSLII